MGGDARTMDIKEAAKILGVTENTAYRAAALGQLPVLRICGRVLILRQPFERMLDGQNLALQAVSNG